MGYGYGAAAHEQREYRPTLQGRNFASLDRSLFCTHTPIKLISASILPL